MSQLNRNTSTMEALLEAINALPEAGGGGLKMASGTLTASSNASNSLTLTGLDFRPVVVFFFGAAAFSIPFYGYGMEDATGYGRISTDIKFTTQLTSTEGGCTLTGTKYSGGSQTMIPSYGAEVTWYAYGE